MEDITHKRAAFIDIYKAFAIFLVVLGHTTICSPWLTRWIYSFHMPAFFAVYGMSYDPEKHRERGWFTWSFLLGKTKRLLVPCFVWGLIYADFSIKNIAFVAWGSQASFRRAGSLSSLWFLTCMFLAVCAFELLTWGISRLSKARMRGAALTSAAVLCFAAGCLLPRVGIGYPWCADVMFPALSFLIAGYGLRCLICRPPKLRESAPLPWGVLLIASALLTLLFIPNLSYIRGNNADFAARSFGSPFLYVPAALAGILMLTSLSVLLSKFHRTRFLAWIGRRSLAILLLHKYPVMFLSARLSERGFGSTWAAVLLSLAITACCCLAAWMLERLAPNLIGIERSQIQ